MGRWAGACGVALLGGYLGLVTYPFAEPAHPLQAPVTALERLAYDAAFALRGGRRADLDPRIVVVGFDNQTEARLGRPWPASRAVVGQAVLNMKRDGASAIVLDLLFESAGDPSEDRALDAALREAGNCLLAVRFDRDPDPNVLRKALVGPFYDPETRVDFEAAARIGFTEVPVDGDGVVRRFLPVVMLMDEPVPSLAVGAVLAVTPGASLRKGQGILDVAGHKVPLSGPETRDPVDGSLLSSVDVRFAGGGRAFPNPCDLAQAASGAFPPGTFRGKVAFVGVTGTQQAKELGDARVLASTSLAPEARGGAVRRDVPGVVLQAHYANAILQGLWLRPVEAAPRSLWGALIALGFASLARRYPDARGVAGVLLGGIAAMALQVWLMLGAGWILPSASVTLGSAAMALGVAWADRSRLRRRWARYVSPAVFRVIVDTDERALQSRCRATVLFADLRGFTSFANQHPPGEVFEVLNRHLARLVPAIEREGGTLDKFLGDGLLAVFGAPVPLSEPEARAVRAALEMARICEAPIVDNRGRFWQFDVGFGLATGEVVAGLVGSARRHDFTVIGDAVNRASRIQALSEGEVVADEHTMRKLGEGFVVEELEEAHLKGIDEAVRCYRIEGGAARHGLVTSDGG